MPRKVFHLGDIEINENSAPLVIVEIGINHGGSLQVAKQMVDAAKRSGAYCIKHQTHIVEDEMSISAQYVIPGNSKISIYDIMKNCALSCDEEYELKKYVEKNDMFFLSTPFSRAAANRLHDFGVDAYKIGSGECNNYPLIEHIASFGKPMIVSTGMNTLKSIGKTAVILDKANVEYAFLHTTNLYPTPIRLVRLNAMLELSKAFPDVLFGLSDHTLNNNACLAATALGATILERHFTDTMDRLGPDIVCSMDEYSLKELLTNSAEISQMRGGHKTASLEEQVTMDFAFATVVTIKNIKKGETFNKNNLWVKRPGCGEISAEEFQNILGKKAATDIAADVHLSYNMLGDI